MTIATCQKARIALISWKTLYNLRAVKENIDRWYHWIEYQERILFRIKTPLFTIQIIRKVRQ